MKMITNFYKLKNDGVIYYAVGLLSPGYHYLNDETPINVKITVYNTQNE